MSLRVEDYHDWIGQTVVDPEGEKVGKLEDIVFSADGAPLLGAISTGLFGRRRSLVPLDGAGLSPNHVTVSHAKATIKDAPQLDAAESMSAAVEDATDAHYGTPPRARAAEEAYDTATLRAERRREAADADRRATELEQRAERLRADAEKARADAEAAADRAEAARRDFEATQAEARQARAEAERLAG